MPRNLIQDVVPPKRKKPNLLLKDRLPKKEEPKGPFKTLTAAKIPPIAEKNWKFPELKPRRLEDHWRRKPMLFWGTCGVAVVFAVGLILSVYYSSAAVTITPRTAVKQVRVSFVASKTSAEGVPFEVFMTKGTGSKSIAASGTKPLAQKASGRIVVYNNYSTASQKLIASTRFQTANGKIYRIANDISVPGMIKKNGDTVPGSIEVTIYADKPGAAYNSGLTDFTIPGFKGDPRYQKFYGRSKTEISGGYSGLAPVASDKDIAKAKKELEESLKSDLLTDAKAQVPEGYILYSDAVQVSYDSKRNPGGDPKSVILEENGTLVGVLLKKDVLLGQLAVNIAKDSKDNQPFTFNSLDELIFAFGSGSGAINEETANIPFTLNGDATVTYSVDSAALQKDLSGKPKKDFVGVMTNYPSVYKAKITEFSPFWARFFPASADKIMINMDK